MDIEDLNSKNIVIGFVRRSKKSLDESFDENGFLREDAIIPEDVTGLSVNILGGKFKPNYIKFRIKKPGSNYWNGKSVWYLKYLPCIETMESSAPIYFLLVDIHDEKFPYSFAAASDKAKQVLKALGHKPPFTYPARLEGFIKIKHAPSNLNYWHAEFRLFDAEKKLIPKVTTQWTRSAAELALADVIAMKARKVLRLEDYSAIEPIHYHNAI